MWILGLRKRGMRSLSVFESTAVARSRNTPARHVQLIAGIRLNAETQLCSKQRSPDDEKACLVHKSRQSVLSAIKKAIYDCTQISGEFRHATSDRAINRRATSPRRRSWLDPAVSVFQRTKAATGAFVHPFTVIARL